jgi:hypothetical protein
MGNLRQKYTDEEWDNLPYELAKQLNKSEKQGGFFDLPQAARCKDKSHEPPTHIHIPQGKGYRHVCPSCGKVTDLIPPQISF